jgi:hypothetical protein
MKNEEEGEMEKKKKKRKSGPTEPHEGGIRNFIAFESIKKKKVKKKKKNGRPCPLTDPAKVDKDKTRQDETAG